ncbi:hypothetical protein [Chryseobacterium gallinarum]|uniref:Uncharacterized protein n=1 Tax=Chryseobacterium gallinarum TaxID=1324352 RepID=A0ABX6KL12_CHRGL|nr:hypothetical protein [Chryseobacterium gallinarum]QIY89331.1 hypothetical protein FOB44_01120 [Chryseobacterium gallinarum]
MEIQNSLKKETTERLAYLFFMDQHYYSKEYLQAVREELQDRNYNFNNLNEHLYIRYFMEDLYVGWRKEAKRMFAELSANGWTYQQPIYYKYSWGSFTMKGFHTDAHELLHSILNKYLNIYGETCSSCGSKKQVSGSLEEPLCRKCELKILKKRRIKNINKFGFTYYRNKFQHVLWTEIKRIEFVVTDDHSFGITLSKLTEKEELEKEYDEHDTISFHSDSCNFFKLVTKIPKELLTEHQYREIHNICNHFEKCMVCHRKSVFDDQCLICRNKISFIESPSSKSLERFKTKAGILAHRQKDFKRILKVLPAYKYSYETDSFFKSK